MVRRPGIPSQARMLRRHRRWVVRCDRGAEAWEKCDNVHHGLLRRVRVVVVVDNTSTRDLRQKPYQVANFGEGIEK